MMRPSSDVVVGKEQCPKCKAVGKDTRQDNLIRYEDGHAYCFSCQHRIPSTQEQMLRNALSQNEEKVKDLKNKVLTLPFGVCRTIDAKALQWLDKYGIIRDEIIANDIRWEELQQWLYFPIRDGTGQLLAWQARNFHPNENPGMKWYSKGKIHDILHILGFKNHPDSPVVIVEDIVSAIKVSRHCRAMPLFGSNLSTAFLLRLKHLAKGVIIWLDSDKFEEAVFYGRRAPIIGLKSSVVFTQKDPKEHSDDQIKAIVKNNIDSM